MSRTYKIKWRKSDTKKLANLARQFNAKITRVSKKYPDFAQYLPKRISTKEIKSRVATRQDFNRLYKEYSRFLKKGAEELVTTPTGITVTKWDIQEAKYKVQAVNRSRARKRKELKGIVTTESGTMGSIQNANLMPKQFNLSDINDWDAYVGNLDKQLHSQYYVKKEAKYRENFIQALYNVFNSEADDIINLVNQIPDSELSKLYFSNPVLQIDFIYDPLEQEMIHDLIVENLQEYLDTR